jgi:hypothetical protein
MTGTFDGTRDISGLLAIMPAAIDIDLQFPPTLLCIGGVAAQGACREGSFSRPIDPTSPRPSPPQGAERESAPAPTQRLITRATRRSRDTPTRRQACTAAAAVSATARGPHPFSTGSTSFANSRIEASAFASGIPPNRNELFSSKSPSSSRRASYARST